MKRYFLALTVFIWSIVGANAQIELGVKGGLSSYDLANQPLIIDDGLQHIEWSIKEAGYGHHFGLYTRLSLLGVYLEPSLLFNSNTVTYDIDTYGESGIIKTLVNEKYQTVDIPVLAGFKIGVLRFQGGVVGHFLINSISDVIDVKNYEQRFNNATYGWQGGTGIDLWRLRLDLLFEGNFSQFGDHISVGGRYAFADTPNRFILTLGFKF
ncbi:MAG: hypothetical protein LC127_13090 [Chitinophagales bacterium]|nr:hypothetical protein [Chitinophagales bacterium]